MAIRSIVAFVLLAGGLFAVAGCAPWATYPPVEHTAKLVNPSFEPMPTLMAKAITFVHDEQAAMPELVYNLPSGVPMRTYEIVQKKLAGGRPMQLSDSRAYHVTAVRTRGPEAEVDVIVPRTDGLHELQTVRFKQKFGKGYQVTSSRQWRLRVEPPMANYQPPIEQTEFAGVSDESSSGQPE